MNYQLVQSKKQEINRIYSEFQRMSLEKAVEMGEHLIVVKKEVGHGNFGAWLKNNVEFSQLSAEIYMGFYELDKRGELDRSIGWERARKLLTHKPEPPPVKAEPKEQGPLDEFEQHKKDSEVFDKTGKWPPLPGNIEPLPANVENPISQIVEKTEVTPIKILPGKIIKTEEAVEEELTPENKQEWDSLLEEFKVFFTRMPKEYKAKFIKWVLAEPERMAA